MRQYFCRLHKRQFFDSVAGFVRLLFCFVLHEKGGKVNELPCHHNLGTFLDEWPLHSGLATEPTSPLFTMWHGKLTDRTLLARPTPK